MCEVRRRNCKRFTVLERNKPYGPSALFHRRRLTSFRQVAARRKELFAEHRCQPMTTMAIPPLTQLPVFVGCSIVLAHISQHPTPLDSESFLTLSTLVHPDPTATLPIALGFITLANVESSSWFMTDQQREHEVNMEKRKEKKIAKGEKVIEPQKIIKSALRLVSVGRILIATMVPGVKMLSLYCPSFWLISITECCLILGDIGYVWAATDLVIRLLGIAKEEKISSSPFTVAVIFFAGFLCG